MDIRVEDNAILDTSANKNLLGQVITDVVLTVLAYAAEAKAAVFFCIHVLV